MNVLPNANATAVAEQCRREDMCRCKIFNEACPPNVGPEPSNKYPLHNAAHYCKIYSLCGDDLPKHLQDPTSAAAKTAATTPSKEQEDAPTPAPTAAQAPFIPVGDDNAEDTPNPVEKKKEDTAQQGTTVDPAAIDIVKPAGVDYGTPAAPAEPAGVQVPIAPVTIENGVGALVPEASPAALVPEASPAAALDDTFVPVDDTDSPEFMCRVHGQCDELGEDAPDKVAARKEEQERAKTDKREARKEKAEAEKAKAEAEKAEAERATAAAEAEKAKAEAEKAEAEAAVEKTAATPGSTTPDPEAAAAAAAAAARAAEAQAAEKERAAVDEAKAAAEWAAQDAKAGTVANEYPAIPVYNAPAPTGATYNAPAPTGAEGSAPAAQPAAPVGQPAAAASDYPTVPAYMAPAETKSTYNAPAPTGGRDSAGNNASEVVWTSPAENDCKPIVPGYSDFWCATTCAQKDACPKDICMCGKGAKEASDAVFGEIMDNWGEAEKRERSAAATPGGCTVADCPGGLASDIGKNESEKEEYQKAMDEWKEGEKRVKAADPVAGGGYPYGLPPVDDGQQQQQQQVPEEMVRNSKCQSIGEFKNAERDIWCQTTCALTNQARNCPPQMCECEGGSGEQGESGEAPPEASPLAAPQLPPSTKKSLENRDQAVADRDAKIAERDAEAARILDEKAEREANAPPDPTLEAQAARDAVMAARDEEIASRTPGATGDSAVPDFSTAHGMPVTASPHPDAAAECGGVPCPVPVATAPSTDAPSTAPIGGRAPLEPAEPVVVPPLEVPELPAEPPMLATGTAADGEAVPTLPDAVSPQFDGFSPAEPKAADASAADAPASVDAAARAKAAQEASAARAKAAEEEAAARAKGAEDEAAARANAAAAGIAVPQGALPDEPPPTRPQLQVRNGGVSGKVLIVPPTGRLPDTPPLRDEPGFLDPPPARHDFPDTSVTLAAQTQRGNVLQQKIERLKEIESELAVLKRTHEELSAHEKQEVGHGL